MADTLESFRPVSTIDSAGWTLTFPSGGTAHGHLSDGDYGTRVSPYPGVGGPLKLGMAKLTTPFVLPDRAQVRQVRPAVVIDCVGGAGGNNRAALLVRPYVGPTAHPHLQEVLTTVAEGVKLKRLPGLRTNPWGETWTQNDLDNLRFHAVRQWADDPDRPRLAEVYLSVLWNAAPVVVATGPSDPVTDTSTPTITWTYSDSNGDPQERIHAYVYPESVYSQPGFSVPSPDRVDNFAGVRRPPGAVWESAQPVWTSATSIQITTPLTNGRYRAYVFGADLGSNGRYSAGSYVEWSQNAPAPLPPSLVAEVQ